MIQYNNFLMKREQSRAGSRFAECEKSRLKAKLLITLALLLTAVTGAWADETPIVTITATGSGPAYSVEGIVTLETGGAGYGAGYGWVSGPANNLTVTAADGVTITKVKFIGNQGGSWEDTESPFQVLLQGFYVKNASGTKIGSDDGVISIEVYGTAEPPIEVTPVAEPAANTKQWTFSMPGSDVVLTPLYAPAAQWAKDKEVDQIPTAIEGIFAGTTDAIVKAGTVAMMGKTENPQGIVMYAVTSTNQATAPELSAFSATVPTAENIADEGADVLVWYYIAGADTPDGEEATAENTFNDSEICTTPITVTVLSNKFDITFNAANANTIEAGKATVTVSGTAATVTEGKLEGVKMGSEVKMTAKEGYKFRKVEAKKKSVGPVLNLTNPAVGQVIGSDGKNYAYASLPTGVTAVAKICYVSGSNGLALALTDEGQMNYSTAQTTCAAHTPAFTGGTWKLASEDEWNSMISAAGSYSSLRKGFSSVGGTNMQRELYWSSTEYSSDRMCVYDFSDGNWYDDRRDRERYVRACLAF